jgi:hypothetical protein
VGGVQPDSGAPGTGGDTGSGDSGGASEGPGRVRVQFPGLTGYPAHGFIVFATPEGTDTATAAFCQIIGLGERAPPYRVEVKWPSGIEQSVDLGPDQRAVVITETDI